METVMEILGEYALSDVDISNIDEIFEIYSSNEEYFILSGGSPATVDNIHQDMKEGPPNTKREQKQYKAIKLDKKYIGVIDYIMEYPDIDSVFIGLFIIRKDLQGQGYGNKIINVFEEKMKEKGFKRIRLGVLHNNESGFRFWQNKGFKVIKKEHSTIDSERNWIIKVMEKEI